MGSTLSNNTHYMPNTLVHDDCKRRAKDRSQATNNRNDISEPSYTSVLRKKEKEDKAPPHLRDKNLRRKLLVSVQSVNNFCFMSTRRTKSQYESISAVHLNNRKPVISSYLKNQDINYPIKTHEVAFLPEYPIKGILTEASFKVILKSNF
ncbi:hypothetical protein GJ496_000681 [Pomphorhynchus laevis]|nr:hypothetical protein GJ496_000681 [Pomphorhynchus laevis]